jgi:hypothetical protein
MRYRYTVFKVCTYILVSIITKSANLLSYITIKCIILYRVIMCFIECYMYILIPHCIWERFQKRNHGPSSKPGQNTWKTYNMYSIPTAIDFPFLILQIKDMPSPLKLLTGSTPLPQFILCNIIQHLFIALVFLHYRQIKTWFLVQKTWSVWDLMDAMHVETQEKLTPLFILFCFSKKCREVCSKI